MTPQLGMSLDPGLQVRLRDGTVGTVVTRGQERVYVRVETPDQRHTYLVEEWVRDLAIIGV